MKNVDEIILEVLKNFKISLLKIERKIKIKEICSNQEIK